MPELVPLVIQELDALARLLKSKFNPPEFYPGCEVLSVADKDQYDASNGWIVARVERHNAQRIRYRGTPAGVAVSDFVDVILFPNIKLFQVFGVGGSGSTSSPIDSQTVSKIYESDGGAVALSADANGNLTGVGSLALTTEGLTLANGLNSNIALGHTSTARITGPTGAFSVGGFTAGADGRILYLFNDVAQTMTIVNADGSSTAANQITTLTGGDVVLRASGRSFATFVYSGANSRWILAATN